ncbi:MAG: DNA replication/repair protein RecF [Micropepsaceae bacterium]
MLNCGAAERPVASPPEHKLALKTIRLVNFRSYSDATLDVPSGPVVLAGANGTGKTNCLEAISLLSPGRGLRGARLGEMQRNAPHDANVQEAVDGFLLGASLWTVAATLERTDGSWEVGTGLAPLSPGANAKRVTHLNGAPAQSADFADLAPMLWLTPAQDRLFLDGAGDRRRFLDRLVFGLDGGHAKRTNRYERAMRERLRLLKEGRFDPVWLDGLEETMAAMGIALTEARENMIDLLNEELHLRGQAGNFPCAHLALEDGLDGASDAVALQEKFSALRRRDSESGRTNLGPHIGDLRVRHTLKRADARDCSTGEQKALLISIVLANAWLQKRRKTESAPILLLDEVVAHLDSERRAALFEEILSLSAQAWLTGTDSSLFTPLAGHAALVSIEAGQFLTTDWP